jgi:phage recombination protein Bet
MTKDNLALAMTTSRSDSVLTHYNDEQTTLLKQEIAPGCNDVELALFLTLCERRGLDPFARQIYAIKRKQWDSRTQREEEKMTIQTGIDGFRAIADRTGTYSPGNESFDDVAKTATVSVNKLVAGQWREFSATAHYDEYCQRKKDGSPVAMWAKMPRSQLAKCAEAKALRKGWPEQLGGLYTGDEMAQADNPPPVNAVTQGRVVDAAFVASSGGQEHSDERSPDTAMASPTLDQVVASFKAATNLEVLQSLGVEFGRTFAGADRELLLEVYRDCAGRLKKTAVA